ncbi:MAG: hypothetical protein O7J95_07125, partial [Planctomycetota bacterium]|nr:hypothetical protein [Planctomycetota bacterium]
MKTPGLPSIVLGLLLSSPVHFALQQEAKDEALEVTTASADAAQRLLADYEDAMASKEGRKVMRVLDRMAAHDNADFLEAATKSLKYKA